MRLADLLVDLAAVAGASRAVASKHVALRVRQAERYGRGSSVVGAVLAGTRGQGHGRAPGEHAEAPAPAEHAEHAEEPATAGEGLREQREKQGRREGVHGGQEGELVRRDEEAPVAGEVRESEVPVPEREGKVEERKAAEPVVRIPVEEPHQKTAEEKSGFVPAPWASGGIAALKHGFVPPKQPPQIPRKPLAGVSGIDLNLFRTRGGSSILEAMKEMEKEEEKEPRVAHAHVEDSAVPEAGTEKAEAAERSELKPETRVEPEAVGLPSKAKDVTEDVTEKKPAEEPNTVPASEPTLTPLEAPEEQLRTGTTSKAQDLDKASIPEPQPHTSATPTAEPTEAKTISQEDASIVAELTGSPISSGTPGYQLRESAVPSSRIGRLWNYGGLAAGMFAGAIGEGLSRAVGGGGSGSVMLSSANMERLVAKLSRMRGAALKLGQMMSFQDAKMLPAPIQEVLQRVQDRADYMPGWQRNRVLTADLGENWRDLFDEFEDKPIAAASIGQVHRATLKSNGARVAVKIQFPGVADSINSDLDNLAVLLAATKLLPKGLYLNKTIDNARTELAWECDYAREAACAQRYRDLLASSPEQNTVFSVPQIYPSASGPHVLTMEFMSGTAVTRIASFTQTQRDWIGTQILRLCLREIAEFRFMQTDPNWTNFLFNAATGRLELLDFGASREYPGEFIALYVRLLEAASRADREGVQVLSEKLGYLTGHESKAMLDAHVTSVVTLAEPFLQSAPEVYDFRGQTITERVKEQIPVMIHERLAPPPEETYSLHRKLSGAFLLCARLGSRVRCRELFVEALAKAGIKSE